MKDKWIKYCYLWFSSSSCTTSSAQNMLNAQKQQQHEQHITFIQFHYTSTVLYGLTGLFLWEIYRKIHFTASFLYVICWCQKWKYTLHRLLPFFHNKKYVKFSNAHRERKKINIETLIYIYAIFFSELRTLLFPSWVSLFLFYFRILTNKMKIKLDIESKNNSHNKLIYIKFHTTTASLHT